MTDPSHRTGPPNGLQGSHTTLAARYDVALLDLDGVVYIGAQAVPGAAGALAEARAAGMRLAFVTNNAARTPATVAAHLRHLGVPADDADVVTSAQAAARLVAQRVPPGAAVLVVGGAGLEVALRELDLRPVHSADDRPAAVVQGFAPDVGWRLLTEGAIAVARGAPWIASNADLTIPTTRGLAPGNGALLHAIRVVTGAEPVVAGKPELPLHRESILRTAAQRPLVVGDRLDTDIEGACRGGSDSLLVLTGVTSPRELLLAPVTARPTYLAADLRGLLTTHPSPSVGDAAWRCGGWVIHYAGGRLRPTGGGDPYDGLRALCAAVWALPRTRDGAEWLAEIGALSALHQLGL